MKYLLIILVGIGIAGGVVALNGLSSTAVINSVEHIEVEKEVVIKELDKRVEEAQEAARKEIEAKAQAAYDSAYDQAMKEVKLEVVENYRKEVEAMETELSKEVGQYWRDPKNVIQLIRETFPEDPHTAVAVARCESGLKPTAYNPTNKNGSTDGGLWQINSVHDKTLEAMGLDKWNPEDATKFARYLYEKNGWRDWVCYTHGMLAMR